MPTVTSSLRATASLVWQLERAITGFEPARHSPGAVSFSEALTASAYPQVFFAQYTLTAGASQVVDLRSFTSAVCEAVTATGVVAMMLEASAGTTGGQLKLEPSGTDGLMWFFGGMTQSLTLDVGTNGACLFVCEGVTHAMTVAAKNMTISNPGSQTVVVKLAAVLSTA